MCIGLLTYSVMHVNWYQYIIYEYNYFKPSTNNSQIIRFTYKTTPASQQGQMILTFKFKTVYICIQNNVLFAIYRDIPLNTTKPHIPLLLVWKPITCFVATSIIDKDWYV